MKRVSALLLMCAGLVAAQGLRPGFGGRGGFTWWENPALLENPAASGLNLSDAQTNQIRAAVKEYRNKLVDLRGAVEKAEGDLSDVFETTPIDQRKANDAIERLGNARGEMTKTLSQMSLKLRAVLTNEQWQQLQKRQRGPREFTGSPAPRSDADAAPNGGPKGFPRRRGPGGPPPGDQPAPPAPATKE